MYGFGKKRRQNFSLIFTAAVSILKEWKQAQPLSAPLQSLIVDPGGRKWRPPVAGCFKCNVDGAITLELLKCGLVLCYVLKMVGW